MESLSQYKKMNRIILFTLGYATVLLGALPLPNVDAGTVFLMPPPPRKLTDADLNRDEDYPESHFGSAPSRKIASDSKTHFSARESDDWDYKSERAAAGLNDEETYAGKSAPVRAPASELESDYVASGAAHTIRTNNAEYTSGSARKIASLTEDRPTQKAVPELEASAMRRKGVQEVALIASDLGFFPKAFFVSRSVPVRLYVTGASKNSLCIMMDSFQVRKQVRSQKIEEITFTPNQPGTFRFYCPVNGMEGTMVVKELVSSTQE